MIENRENLDLKPALDLGRVVNVLRKLGIRENKWKNKY